jgi:hypothetical protein
VNCRMIAATAAGSSWNAKWPCPSRTRISVLGIAAAARCARSLTSRRGFRARQHQRSRRDSVELAGPVGPALLGPALPRQSRGGREAHRPQKARSHRVALVLRQIEGAGRDEDRRFSIARGQRILDRLDRTGRIGEAETRLVEDEMVDVARQGGCAHGTTRPVRVTPKRDLPGSDILELPLDGITAASVLAPKPRRSIAKVVMPSRSSATRGSNRVWSHIEPCTSTSGGPSPSTHTASNVPSRDRTSNRLAPLTGAFFLANGSETRPWTPKPGGNTPRERPRLHGLGAASW